LPSSNNRRVVGGNNAGAVCSFDSETTIRNSTIARNVSERSTLIIVNSNTPGFPSVVNLGNTIIAENEHDFGADVDNNVGAAQIVSVGGNLIGTTVNVAPGTFTLPNDTLGQNPLLAPTNSNQGGHPIDTHPLQAGSPALNTGLGANAIDPRSGTPLTTDARGGVFPRVAGGTVDKGAFEDQSNGSSLVVTKLANSNDNVCDTDCSLREAVFAASQDPGTDNITMAANVFGTMIVGTEIQIDGHDVNIIGYPFINSNTLIVSGNNVSRVFRCENANVTMTGFTIANGTGEGQSQPFGGGGMLFGSGNLTLNQMIIRNNASVASDLGSGGGLAVFSGSVVRIMNSTINNNSSYASFGATIHASVIYITNTTIANNSYIPPGEAGFGALSINGTLYMRNSTVANNRAPNSTTGSGLFCGGSSICNLGNNIFSDNLATNGNDLFVSPGGEIQSVGGNLVENLTGFDNSEFDQINDDLGVDPMLGALADNGGNVTTLALGGGSPAANRGVNANAIDPFSSAPLTTDARGSGFTRMVGTVDKGAYERLAPSAASVSVSGRVIAGKGGVPNAVVTITNMNGHSQSVRTTPFGAYRFDGLHAGQNYIVTVSAKQFQFGSHAVTLTDDLADLDFYAVE
jgi:CSLREA domain-containing protein